MINLSFAQHIGMSPYKITDECEFDIDLCSLSVRRVCGVPSNVHAVTVRLCKQRPARVGTANQKKKSKLFTIKAPRRTVTVWSKNSGKYASVRRITSLREYSGQFTPGVKVLLATYYGDGYRFLYLRWK